MKTGLSTRLITPHWPVLMGGYIQRKGRSQGVHDDLFIKTVLFEEGNNRILIISCDAISFKNSFVVELKSAIKQEFGYLEHEIFLTATHTHSAVTEIESFHSGKLNSPEKEYMQYMFNRIIESVKEACNYTFESTLEVGQSVSHIGLNRRLKKGNSIVIGPNWEKSVDRELIVLLVKDKYNKIRLVLFNTACHPTVLNSNNMLISSEFPGATCRKIKDVYPECIPIFIQGACGDIDPMVRDTGNAFKAEEADYSDMNLTGRILAHEVLYTIKNCKSIKTEGIKKALIKIKLPIDVFSKDYCIKLNDTLSNDNWMKPWCVEMIKRHVSGEIVNSIDFSVHFIELSPVLRFVGLEGEIFNSIGESIKALFSRGVTFVAGYANGCTGYVPDSKSSNEEGYELKTAPAYYGLDGSFSSKCESMILDAVKKFKGEGQ